MDSESTLNSNRLKAHGVIESNLFSMHIGDIRVCIVISQDFRYK